MRVICSRPYHALFMHTMLIRPTKHELAEFGKPDIVIYNAGSFPANSLTGNLRVNVAVRPGYIRSNYDINRLLNLRWHSRIW